MKNKFSIIFLTIVLIFTSLEAQTNKIGIVIDNEGKPVAGAMVKVINSPSNKIITDEQGRAVLPVEVGEFVEISISGQYVKRVKVSNEGFLAVLDNSALEMNLGHLIKSKKNLTQSVSTITSEELSQNSSARLYEALYGLLPGAAVLQSGGYNSNNSIYIRGAGTLSNQAPLFVVDGFPRPIENITISEIESVTVLKDGVAAALWGSRGANGVVLIETKRGKYKTMEFSADYKRGFGYTTNQAKMADAATYAEAVNEALLNDGLVKRYSDAEINAFRNNQYPALYPNTDWLKEGLRDHSDNNQLNLTFRGGGEKARYFTVIDYKNDFGLLNYADYDGRFSTQLKRYDLNMRINLDIDITPTTTYQVNLLGMINETKRPGGINANAVIESLYTIPSAAFPVFTESGIWGSDNIFNSNPIADIASTGYNRATNRMLQGDMRLTQNLSMLIKGLSAEIAVAYDNNASFSEPYTKKYQYEINIPTMDPVTGEITNVNTSRFGEESALKFSSSLASQFMRTGLEANFKYDRTFGIHAINAAAIYRQETHIPDGRNGSRYRQYIMGTASYSYDDRIFIDGVLNYYGSSVMSKGNRFKLYPGLSAAWITLADYKAIDFLKFRASWGISGSDAFDYELDRQYWVSGGNYYFISGNTKYTGIKEGALPVAGLTCETAGKFNVGADLSLQHKLILNADVFYERRSDILVDGTSVISSAIGVGIPQLNMGVVDSKGAEISGKWTDKIGDLTYFVGGNLSFVRTSIIENNEGYVPYPYLSQKGNRIGQIYGLEAIGYFRDQDDINDSPVQQFGSVRPGDIKYLDKNGDSQINDEDKMPIGFSNVSPELYYGIQLGFEYRRFGVNAQFQGAGNYSIMLNTKNVYWPLQNNTNISTWYLEENIRWTEATKETANLPRLTTIDNPNNFRASTQWLTDASFFKLRNLKVYYNLPDKMVQKIKLKSAQVYASGNDLFSLDHVPYLNCEDISMKYPNLSTLYVGVNIKF
ncbi:MAG: SusC/RagA family TonB-linked outer membrane protein [Paludibacter sp.]|nr:SusC/RagA family TonB-linked outer membrane protein [Paludibacter sp.]